MEFEEFLAEARKLAGPPEGIRPGPGGMTEPEFDYSLARGELPHGWYQELNTADDVLRAVAMRIARERHPEIQEGQPDYWTRLAEVTETVLDEYRPQIEERRAAAKARSYSGWSNASAARGLPIEYLD